VKSEARVLLVLIEGLREISGAEDCVPFKIRWGVIVVVFVVAG
jgi:hypothetical protein